jgi:bifunctional non-homologous end joining protein LigD
LARLLENEHRDLVVSDMKKAIRTNKVFVDWSQNDEHKTTISVYALRARERPTVSTPVTWDEVEHALKKKDAKLLIFESKQTLERVEKMGDLFAPLLSLKQKLPKLPGVGEGKAEAVASGLQIAAQAESKGPKRPGVAKKKAAAGKQSSSSKKVRKRI